MFKLSVFVICMCLSALTSYLTYAMTPEQKAAIHAHFESSGRTCILDNIISDDDVTNLRARKVPTGPNAPCFLACMLKKIGVMDQAGLLQDEKTLELARQIFNDPEEIQMIADYLKSCSHVNDAAVSDGEKGCDRAIMAYKCMTENAAQFNFEV